MLDQPHKKTSLRFRRWSRKSYATFSTIGRFVTIGHVKGIVADSLLKKQKRTLPPFDNFFFFSENEYEDSGGPPETEAPLLLQTPLFYNIKIPATGYSTELPSKLLFSNTG